MSSADKSWMSLGLNFATRALFPLTSGKEDMRVSVYNDGDESIRVIADRKVGNETLIDAGEEVVLEAERMIQLIEIGGADPTDPDEDADDEGLER